MGKAGRVATTGLLKTMGSDTSLGFIEISSKANPFTSSPNLFNTFEHTVSFSLLGKSTLRFPLTT